MSVGQRSTAWGPKALRAAERYIPGGPVTSDLITHTHVMVKPYEVLTCVDYGDAGIICAAEGSMIPTLILVLCAGWSRPVPGRGSWWWNIPILQQRYCLRSGISPRYPCASLSRCILTPIKRRFRSCVATEKATSAPVQWPIPTDLQICSIC